MDYQKTQEEDYKQTTRKVNEGLALCLTSIQYAPDADCRDNSLIYLVGVLNEFCTIQFGNDIDREYLIAVIHYGKETADREKEQIK